MGQAKPAAWLRDLRDRRDRLITFWHRGMWEADLAPLPRPKRVGLRCLRIIYLVQRGFQQDSVRQLAAALTFATLMSLVPLLALSLAVLKGLGFGDQLLIEMQTYLADMPQQFREFADQVVNLVTTTNFARLGGIGGVILLTMVVQVISQVEGAFNLIWGLKEQRSWGRRITNYISIIVMVPILLVAAITVTAQFKFSDTLEGLGLVRLVPFFASWIAFFLLYMAMPNTRVRFFAAFVSGLVGAIMWQMWLRLYIWVQPGVTKYNVIYGTLASVPIFLAWLYVSWLIVLCGALVTHAMQNEKVYQLDRANRPIGTKTQLATAFAMLFEARRALEGQNAFLDLAAFAYRFHIPPRLVDDLAVRLVNAGFLVGVADQPDHFVLARHPDKFSMKEVAEVVLANHCDQEADDLARFDADVRELVEAFERGMDRDLGPQLLSRVGSAPN